MIHAGAPQLEQGEKRRVRCSQSLFHQLVSHCYPSRIAMQAKNQDNLADRLSESGLGVHVLRSACILTAPSAVGIDGDGE